MKKKRYYPFRKVRHLPFSTLNAITGEYYTPENRDDFALKPCRSATCSWGLCQENAVKDRKLALRYVSRGRKLRRLTVTKFQDVSVADTAFLEFRKVFRAHGFSWEDYPVVEAHSTGLLHLHILVSTDASDEEIERLYRSEVEPMLDLTEWSTFDISHNTGAKSAGYLLEDAKKKMGLHLALNKGRLHRSVSRGFFQWGGVRTMKEAIKAERQRSKFFKKVEGLKGRRKASRLTENLVTVEQVEAVLKALEEAGKYPALEVSFYYSPDLPIGAVIRGGVAAGGVGYRFVSFGIPP